MRKKHSALYRSVVSVFLLLLLLSASFSCAYAGESTDSALSNFYRTQAQITRWLEAHPVDPARQETSGTASPSDQELQSAFHLIQNIRYIAGLPKTLELSASYNRTAQAAAAVSRANGRLSHHPKTPVGLSKDLAKRGVRGCGSCNLTWASWENCSLEQSILHFWMKDDSRTNIKTLGHRRWILNPKMKKTGFGFVSGSGGTYSAMYIFDFSRKVKRNYQIAWPAQNMPVSYFPEGTPWSFSPGREVDASKISVKLTRLSDRKVWRFSEKSADGRFYVNNEGYGQKGCIIFDPSDIGACSAGDVYSVQITGAGKKISYTVNFF